MQSDPFWNAECMAQAEGSLCAVGFEGCWQLPAASDIAPPSLSVAEGKLTGPGSVSLPVKQGQTTVAVTELPAAQCDPLCLPHHKCPHTWVSSPSST